MTCIIISNGQVLHDSSAELYGLSTTRMNKIKPVSEPFSCHSVRESYRDTIVGVGGSGAGDVLDEFFKSAARVPLDNVVDTYDYARGQGLINQQNQFTAALVGVKGTMVVTVERDSCRAEYTPHDIERIIVMGSGESAASRLIKDPSNNPTALNLIRLMYAVFAMEPTCYGYVSAWEVREEPTPALVWVGLNNVKSQAEVRVIAANLCDELPFDLYSDRGPLPWPVITADDIKSRDSEEAERAGQMELKAKVAEIRAKRNNRKTQPTTEKGKTDGKESVRGDQKDPPGAAVQARSGGVRRGNGNRQKAPGRVS